MLRAYQSEENYESAREASTSDYGNEVDSDETGDGDDSNGDNGDGYIDTDVDRQLDLGTKKLWWQELGPRTRGGPRVNYSENKHRAPRLSSPKVGIFFHDFR